MSKALAFLKHRKKIVLRIVIPNTRPLSAYLRHAVAPGAFACGVVLLARQRLYYEDGLEIEYRLTSSEWVNLPLDEGTGKSYYLDHQPEIEQEIIENRLETLVANHNLTVDEQGFVHFSKGSPADQ